MRGGGHRIECLWSRLVNGFVAPPQIKKIPTFWPRFENFWKQIGNHQPPLQNLISTKSMICSNREQLSHNDMTVMGLHRAIVELEFSHVH